MLEFKFTTNEHYPEFHNTTDIYEFFGCLQITVGNTVLYNEDGVALFELFSSIKKWVKSNYRSFVFNSVESDVVPDLQIIRIKDNQYTLYSAYQRFECNRSFSQKEICNALTNLKSEACASIEVPKKYDFSFEKVN